MFVHIRLQAATLVLRFGIRSHMDGSPNEKGEVHYAAAAPQVFPLGRKLSNGRYSTFQALTHRLLQTGSGRDRHTQRRFGTTQRFSSSRGCVVAKCPRHGRATGVALYILQRRAACGHWHDAFAMQLAGWQLVVSLLTLLPSLYACAYVQLQRLSCGSCGPVCHTSQYCYIQVYAAGPFGSNW